jgi:hypothetical protein
MSVAVEVFVQNQGVARLRQLGYDGYQNWAMTCFCWVASVIGLYQERRTPRSDRRPPQATHQLK